MKRLLWGYVLSVGCAHSVRQASSTSERGALHASASARCGGSEVLATPGPPNGSCSASPHAKADAISIRCDDNHGNSAELRCVDGKVKCDVAGLGRCGPAESSVITK